MKKLTRDSPTTAAKKSNITFLIFTYNESARIKYPIQCFLPYGEVLVVDCFSTDGTPELCRKLGARVIQYDNEWKMVETKKEADFVYKHVKTDWVFWGFADELLPRPCLELFRQISLENRYKAVTQKRKTLLFDSQSEFLPTPITTKFFRKDAIDFTDNKIHHMGTYYPHVRPNEVLLLPPIDMYSVYHYSEYSTESLVSNFNRYSNIDAQQAPAASKHGLKMVGTALWSFGYHYFFEAAFRFGIKGLVVSLQYSLYPLFVWMKRYEKDHHLTRESIRDEFAKGKKDLLKYDPQIKPLPMLLAKLKIWILTPLYRQKNFRSFFKS